MRRFLFTIFFLLLAAPALAQSPGYYVRADCAEITDPVANATFCLQSTTVSGRTAGHSYVYNGSTWVDASSSSSGGHVIKDDGTARAQRTNLNFVGGSVTCIDDSGNDETECTIDVPAGDAPGDATYITQIANGSLSAEFALGSLSSGCLGVTTATGALASRTLTGGSQIAIANGNCSGAPTFSITANSIGPTQIDETANYTWVGVHTFSSATVVGVPASSIVFTPNGSIAATTVQAAIQEVRDEATGGSGDLTEITATLPLTVSSGTGPIPDVRCTTCETTSGSQAKVDLHTSDTSAAHAASAISADSTTLVGTGTNVQSVFEELDNAIVAAEVATAAHLADASAAHAASAISVDSSLLSGAGTDVQAVLLELQACNVNPQTGTTYTFLDSDRCKLVIANNAAVSTYSLPSAAGTGFDAGWYVRIKNIGLGVVTVLPTTSLIDSVTSIDLVTNASATIFSDGTNYWSILNAPISETDTPETVYSRGTLVTGRNSFANAARFEGDTSGTGYAIFHDPTSGLAFNCYAASVENDCDYGRRLNPGKHFSLYDRNGNPIWRLTESITANLITYPTAATRPRKSVWFGAGALDGDGTQCPATATTVVLASGPPTPTFVCTDNDGSSLYGSIRMPDSWDGGTITFTHVYVQTAANTGALNGDITAQCRGNGEAVSNTWGTEIAIDDAAVVGTNSIDQTTSAAVTPAGTCAGGDMLWFRYQLDATGTTTTIASLHHIGFNMEYTISAASD